MAVRKKKAKKTKVAKKAKVTKKAAKKTVAKTAKRKAKKAPVKAKAAKRPVAKKAKVAKKPAKKVKKKTASMGEGNYKATQRFDKAEEKFIAKNRKKIPAMAKAAEAALDGPEGDELRAAEAETAAHAAGQPEE